MKFRIISCPITDKTSTETLQREFKNLMAIKSPESYENYNNIKKALIKELKLREKQFIGSQGEMFTLLLEGKILVNRNNQELYLDKTTGNVVFDDGNKYQKQMKRFIPEHWTVKK